MAKISELSDGGSLLPTDYLIAVRSGGNVKVQADTINVDQIDLGDNEQIRLGNSQDLLIYHDGTNSIINDAGTGSLQLQQGGSTKLEVTTTGIDVSGTVVSDGLTVETDTGITLKDGTDTRTANLFFDLGTFQQYVTGSADIHFYSTDSKTLRMAITGNTGDISFYEDTGTTAKLSWSASNERLGLTGSDYQFYIQQGSNEPWFQRAISNGNYALHLNGTGDVITVDASGNVAIGTTSAYGTNVLSVNGGIAIDGRNASTPGLCEKSDFDTGLWWPAADTVAFTNGGSESMRIDSSGNVGIGVTPSAWGSGTNTALQIRSSGFVQQDSSTNVGLGRNAYQSGTWSYIADGYAQMLNLESDGAFKFFQAGSGTAGNTVSFSQAMTLDASGNLLVGLTSGGKFSVSYGGNDTHFGLGANYDNYITAGSSGVTIFRNATTERMRIDSSGNLLVGKAADDNTTNGFVLDGNGTLNIVRSSQYLARLNRTTTDGEILRFEKDGTSVGSFGATGGDLFIGTGDVGLWFQDGGNAIRPFRVDTQVGLDNSINLGVATTGRFADAYITNGVTTGSDGNDKQDIETLSDAEQRVAVACKGLLRKWRWKDAVEAKGDEARIHFGIIAQDLQAAFEAEGLDAGDYAMFMSNTWTDEETGEERTRLGVRYHELLAFIIAAI